jgi:hypothetical protein
MSKKTSASLETVTRFADIPRFKSEREESEFWATHELSADLWNKAESLPDGLLPQPRPRTRPVAIRFDEATLARLKKLSAHLRKGYQSLLKEFVVERLYEEEKREGFVPITRLRHRSSGESQRQSRDFAAAFTLSPGPYADRSGVSGRALRLKVDSPIDREDYTIPILRYLVKSGGSALTDDVCNAIGRQFEDKFQPADLRTTRSAPGELVWRNEVRWQANNLKRRRLLHPTATSGRGMWSITEAGRELLKARLGAL